MPRYGDPGIASLGVILLHQVAGFLNLAFYICVRIRLNLQDTRPSTTITFVQAKCRTSRPTKTQRANSASHVWPLAAPRRCRCERRSRSPSAQGQAPELSRQRLRFTKACRRHGVTCVSVAYHFATFGFANVHRGKVATLRGLFHF